MEYDIINKYINFVKKELLEFFRLVIGDKYPKNACKMLIYKYVDVRYFNESNYASTRDFVARLNKELLDVYNDNKTPEDDEMLKTAVALFGYIQYIDDVYEVEDGYSVVDLLTQDELLKLNLTDETIKELKKWLSEVNKSKNKFFESILSNDFILTQKSVYRKTYLLGLDSNVKVSNLYSEYAIDKAYNAPIINEDKLFIMLIKCSYELLKNAINLDFTRKYIIDIPATLIVKDKKFKRLLSTIDNTLSRKYIHLRVSYTTYINNKSVFDIIIRYGYNVAIIIDESFDGKINTLAIFSYIFVYEDNEFFDIIKDNEDKIGSKIIKM
jgi:hypothetical protein